MYDYDEIKKMLRTKYISRNFVQFDYLNSIVKKCLKICNNCPNGMLVLCESQADVKISKDRYFNCKDLDQYLFSLVLDEKNIDKKSEVNWTAKCISIMQKSIISAMNEIFRTDIFHSDEKNNVFIGDKEIASVFLNKSRKTDVDKFIITCYIDKCELQKNFSDFFDEKSENFEEKNKENNYEEYIDEKIIASISNNFEILIEMEEN